MPRGVTDQFLKILTNEQKAGVRMALVAVPLAALVYFMAEMTDPPLLGQVVWLAGVALVVGIAAGAFVAWRRTRRYNESLREHWNSWMRMSLSCARVDEVARHVEDKRAAPPVAGVLWTVLFLANVALFMALWIDVAWGYLLGAILTGVNGLVLGSAVGIATWKLVWSRKFQKALQELLAAGEVGIWGEV